MKDLRSCCMDPRGKQLLSLLLAMPTDYSASKNLFGLLTYVRRLVSMGISSHIVGCKCHNSDSTDSVKGRADKGFGDT